MRSSRVGPWLASFFVVTLVLLSWASPQDSTSSKSTILTTSALRLAPADCSFFSTSLRLKEQLLGLWNTKAVQQIWKTSLVQMGWKELMKNWQSQGGPARAMLEQPENQELVQLLIEMASEECFFLGGPTVPAFLTAAGNVFGEAYIAGITSRFAPGGDQPIARVRSMLSALQDNIKDLTIPDFVVGFKTSDTKSAQRQLGRLTALLKNLAQSVPQLSDAIQNNKTDKFEVITINLDGAKLPLDAIPWDMVEEDPGQFKPLRNHLKTMKISLSIGHYDGYVVVALGESLKFLERLGQGKRLAELPEMKPLLNHLDKKLITVGYSNKEMNSGSGFTKQQADAMVDTYLKLLEESQVDDDLRERLEKDIKELGKDMLVMMGREPGPAMGFSFQTARGQESYQYQYSVDPRVDYNKSLGLLKHLGGDPVLAMLGRGVNKPEQWDILVKWMKKADGYFHEFALPMIQQFAGQDTTDMIEKVLGDMYPHLRRLDQTCRTNLFPALADGQSAFVLDNKLTGTLWHREMPAAKKPLPLLEPAFLMGVSDAKKLTQAATDVRDVFNNIALYFHNMQPDRIPRIQWPAPEFAQDKDYRLYWYSLPADAGLDARLKLTAGLSDHLCALTISKEHVERLMQAQPLKVEGGPLADQDRKLGGMVIFKMANLVETAEAWVEYFMQFPELKDARKHGNDIRTILASLKLFHTYSSATYLENNATVTHSEWYLKDIP